MREAQKTQPSLRENWLDLDHAGELQAISRLLDEHPRIEELVLQDLRTACHGQEATRGAGGLSAEQLLRMLVVKQMNGFSYRVLASILRTRAATGPSVAWASPTSYLRNRLSTPTSSLFSRRPWRPSTASSLVLRSKPT
jgi:IS5 family transposase